MDNFVTLKIILLFGFVNNKRMHVQFEINNEVHDVECDNNIGIIRTNLLLPNQIKLIFSGKNLNEDTILDGNGSIISDVYVKVTDLFLNGKKINSYYLPKNLVLIKDDKEKKQTNYIGFNGYSIIEFKQPSFFTQINYFENCIS